MRTSLLKPLGVSIAAVAVTLLAYGASAQEKKAPAKKPVACAKLNETDCRARSDCDYRAAVVDEKTKKVKTKASCKPVPKAPAKKKEPAKK